MASSSFQCRHLCNYLLLLLLVHLSQSPTSAKAQSILLPTSQDQIQGSRCKAQDPNLNYKPVIGILTHPGDGASGRLSKATNASNIPASYVKFVESGGARVIPILYNESPLDIDDKLTLVNGVLFTGGWAKKGPYFETAKRIFEKVLEKNDAGEHFPLFAVNLGFEILTMIVSKNNDILERFGTKNQASTLQFVENTGFEGTLFEKFPPQLVEKLSTDCLVMQNHRFGISPQRFQETTALSNFFKILTTSKDENDKAYVSTAQALKYPITAVQWLPQKNAFEWAAYAMIPHSEDAIEVGQQTVNYFIREARKSSKRSAPGQILKNLIYNYAPTYGGYAGKGYDEVYIFS